MTWLSLVYRQSSCLRSGWEYLRESAEREEWWAKDGKAKCKREKEEESPKETAKIWLEREHHGIEAKMAEFKKEGMPSRPNETKQPGKGRPEKC